MNYQELIESKEYIFNADVSSLYPAAMAGCEFMDVKYPTGISEWSKNPEEDFNNGYTGLYEIKYTPPTDLRVPILMRKEGLALKWSLDPSSGVYTNIDIKNALRHNYEIEFLPKALIWKTTGSVFKKYVTEFYQMKSDAERNGNDVLRNISKLLLNAMYGKTLQKAIIENTSIINSIGEFIAYGDKHIITDYNILNDNKIMLTGKVRDIQSKIKKPNQLGAFVLAYSRSIMLFFMEKIDVSLRSLIFSYSDTDSLHITGEMHQKLKKLGWIVTKNNSKLGYLCSDIKNEGIIIEEKNIAPKNYKYSYIDDQNQIKIDGTMKAKGIPKKEVKAEFYDDDLAHEIHFTNLRKKNKKLSKKDIENNIPNFSIISCDLTRTYNKTQWSAFKLVNNEYYPINYDYIEANMTDNSTDYLEIEDN